MADGSAAVTTTTTSKTRDGKIDDEVALEKEKPSLVSVPLVRGQLVQTTVDDLDKIVGNIRANIAAGLGHAKAEGSSNADGHSKHESAKPDLFMEPLQKLIVRHMMRGCAKFDPSRNASAWHTYKHLAQSLSVTVLGHTHDKVSEVFRHGPHARDSILDLPGKLRTGATRIEDITPLVMIKFAGKFWVVFGNSRLKALTIYQQEVQKDVHMQCIVHDQDGSIPIPPSLLAKFLDAVTTINEGMLVDFHGRATRT